MNDKKENFFSNPTKYHLIVFASLWFVSSALMTLAITDFFAESFFQKRNIVGYFIMAGATLATFRLFINYRKNKT